MHKVTSSKEKKIHIYKIDLPPFRPCMWPRIVGILSWASIFLAWSYPVKTKQAKKHLHQCDDNKNQ